MHTQKYEHEYDTAVRAIADCVRLYSEHDDQRDNPRRNNWSAVVRGAHVPLARQVVAKRAIGRAVIRLGFLPPLRKNPPLSERDPDALHALHGAVAVVRSRRRYYASLLRVSRAYAELRSMEVFTLQLMNVTKRKKGSSENGVPDPAFSSTVCWGARPPSAKYLADAFGLLDDGSLRSPPPQLKGAGDTCRAAFSEDEGLRHVCSRVFQTRWCSVLLLAKGKLDVVPIFSTAKKHERGDRVARRVRELVRAAINDMAAVSVDARVSETRRTLTIHHARVSIRFFKVPRRCDEQARLSVSSSRDTMSVFCGRVNASLASLYSLLFFENGGYRASDQTTANARVVECEAAIDIHSLVDRAQTRAKAIAVTTSNRICVVCWDTLLVPLDIAEGDECDDVDLDCLNVRDLDDLPMELFCGHALHKRCIDRLISFQMCDVKHEMEEDVEREEYLLFHGCHRVEKCMGLRMPVCPMCRIRSACLTPLL